MTATGPTASRSPSRFVAWLGLSLLVAWLMFGGGGWAGIYSTELRTASVVLIAMTLAVWAVAALRNPAWLPRSELLPAFLVALGAFAVGLVLSRNPRLGVEYLAYSVLLTCLYLLLVRLFADPWFRSRLMGIVVIVTLLHGFAYLAQTFSAWIQWWAIVGRITTPPLRPGFGSLLLGNPSAVMTVQVLLAVASVSWLGWSTPARRFLSGLIVVLALAATVISGSRSGWLALGGAFVLWAALWLAAGARRAGLLDRLRSRNTRLAAIGGVVAIGVVAVVLAPGVLFRAAGGGESLRFANYAQAARMFADEPLHGLGPGMWVAQRITYTIPTESDYYIPYAHNLPLQTLAEFGVIGGLAGLIVAMVLARLLWSGLRDPDPSRRRIGWGALLATLYFFAHQLLDFYGNMPAALFAFAIPIALLDATGSDQVSRPVRRERTLGFAAGSAAALAVALLLTVEATAGTMLQAVELADDRRWNEALPLAEDAVRRDPAIPAYQFSLAVIADHAGRPDLAATAYRTAAEADDFPPSWLGLAATQAQAGHPEEARSALAEALRLGRQNAAVLVASADIYLMLGDEPEAVEAFGRALAYAPTLAADERWTTDPRLAEVRDAAFSKAFSLASETTTIELDLAIGDGEKAEALIGELPDGQRELMEILARALEGDATAAATIGEQARAQPLSMDIVLLAARATARQGDERAANEYQFWADTLNGLSSLSSYDLRFAEPDVPVGEIAGLPSRLYGHYTYRRPTPVDQIPAGVLHLAIE